jgi:Bacterial Ig-like domain (group 1)/Putative binding domain, N-terminal
MASASFIQIVTPTNGAGSGNQQLIYTVDPNNTGTALTGSIYINTSVGVQSLSISQAEGSAGTVAVSPNPPAMVASGGGAITFNVTGTFSSAWGWSNPTAGMITVTSCTCGAANGTVVVQISANGTVQRTGSITIAGIVVVITQSANNPGISVSPASFSVAGAGGTVLATVTVNNGPLTSAWTTSVNAAGSGWMQPSCTTCYTGTGQLSLNVAPNPSPTSSRTGVVTISSTAGPASITVTQSPGTLSISPSFVLLQPKGAQLFQAAVNGIVQPSLSLNWSLTDNNYSDSISPSTGPSTTFKAGSAIVLTTSETITATIGSVSATAGVEIAPATQVLWSAPTSAVAGQEIQTALTFWFSSSQFNYGYTGANLENEFNPGTTILITPNVSANGAPPPDYQSCQFTWQNQSYAWFLSLTGQSGSGFAGGSEWNLVGQSPAVNNNLCILDVPNASTSPAGDYTTIEGNEQLNLGITFAPGFTGQMSVWIQALSSGTYNGVPLGPTNVPWTNIGTLTVLAPANVTPTVGTPQSASLSQPFGSSLDVMVTNIDGAVVPNAQVTFAATTGTGGASGTFTGPTTVFTNGSGIATAPALTANSVSGTYSVTATVPAIATPATFSLTNHGSPTTIVASAGVSQSAIVNSAFATPLQVTVTDASGTPVSGATVTFYVPATGASAGFNGSSTAITNISGVATAPLLTANTQAGNYNVTAYVSGVTSPATFSMINLAGAPFSVAASATSRVQSATVNSTFGAPLQVAVQDAYGNPVSGSPVTFTVQGNGASASFGGSTAITVATNNSGVATTSATPLTANTHSGVFIVAATVSGVPTPADFYLTNNAGTPASITATSGSGQSVVVNAINPAPTFATALQATVTDTYGNPVTNTLVTFTATAPAGGPSASFGGSLTATVATDGNGVATAPTLTGNSTGGFYSVAASAANVATNFSLANESIVVSPDGSNNVLLLFFGGPLGWLLPAQNLQFNAIVTGVSRNTSVTWQVAAGAGTISNTGLYSAPNALPAPGSFEPAIILATSQANPSLQGAAIVGTSEPPTMVQSPAISASGSYYNFTVTGNDPNGASSIDVLDMGIQPVGGGTVKCIVEYVQSKSAFYLVDTGDTAGPLPLGSSGSIQNSSCVLTSPTVSPSGNQLTMTLPISFVDTSGLSAGSYYILGFVKDTNGFNSGWKGIGTEALSFSTQAPSLVSLSPTSGSGTSQTFIANYEDPNGAGNISGALLNIFQTSSSVCEVYYATANNSFYLMTQPGNVLSQPLPAGTSGSVQDGECTLTAPTVSYSGNELTLTAPITFSSSFTGTMSIYMWAKDMSGVNSGSENMGSWTVP